VYKGEPFFGEDRIDTLRWRLTKDGLAKDGLAKDSLAKES